jgi:hypothetical protein
MWSYKINPDHPFAVEYLREARNARAAEKILDTDPTVRAAERMAPKNTQSESTRISALWGIRERLSPEAREIVEKLEARGRVFNDRIYQEYHLDEFTRAGTDFAKRSFGSDRGAVDAERERMIDRFKELGVDLSFERYGGKVK